MRGDYPTVYALAVSGSDLYAGGAFTNAGGNEANGIAKWNGSSWSALGSGMNGTVYALAVSGSDLYAGGGFTIAGGKVSAYMARAVLAGPEINVTGNGVSIADGDATPSLADDTDFGSAWAGGGTVVRTPVGQSFISEAMIEHHAVIGGEGNGGVAVPRVLMSKNKVKLLLNLCLLADGACRNARPCLLMRGGELAERRGRLVAVAEDGKRTPIQKVDGAWQRDEQRPAPPEPAESVAPPDPRAPPAALPDAQPNKDCSASSAVVAKASRSG